MSSALRPKAGIAQATRAAPPVKAEFRRAIRRVIILTSPRYIHLYFNLRRYIEFSRAKQGISAPSRGVDPNQEDEQLAAERALAGRCRR
jgi:hypothetical protein